ncbi:MAG: CYTH and CHAD domain-containing protein [Cryobacterium sp.]
MRQLTEIERKYDVDRTLRVPDLSRLPGISGLDFPGSMTLTAVYFDTPDLDLARHQIALRRRDGGADAGWHIKLPADEGRTELQWPLDTDRAAETGADAPVPAPVLAPVRAIVRDRPLTPLARITTIRTTMLLLDETGDPVAELADDDVSASDMRGGVFRKWREWEVELFSAAPHARVDRARLLDAIEAALTAAGAAPSTSLAKIARALGVRGLGPAAASSSPADTLPAPQPQPDARMADSVASVIATLREQHARLLAADPAVRADEPGAVSTMLHAVQRLRNVLGAYGALFDSDTVHGIDIDLTALAAVLAEARHTERNRQGLAVLLDALPPLESLPPGEQTEAVRHAVTGAADEYRAAAHARAVAGLTQRPYFGLLDDLDRFLASPPTVKLSPKHAAAAVRAALQDGVTNLRECARAVTGGEAAGGEAAGEESAPGGSPEPARRQAAAAAQRLRHAVQALSTLPASRRGPGAESRRRLAKAAHRAERALWSDSDSAALADYLDGAAAHARADARADAGGFAGGLVYGLLLGRLAGRAECAGVSTRPDTAALAKAVRRCRALARKL